MSALLDPSDELTAENRRLRRTMRDLVALSTLPAVWIGLGPHGIACSLADALLHMLPLDVVYVRLAELEGETGVEVVRCNPDSAARDEAIEASFAPLLSAIHSDPPATIRDPMGDGILHLAVTRFGVGDGSGVLVAGSRRADFPSESDRLLLGVGANQTAIVLQRWRTEQELIRQQEWLRVTLASIGDAVIATDTKGCVTFLNSVAEKLTGWTLTEAQGQPLKTVFVIHNEQTRQPVENPVEKVLREGVVVGLANHTLLIAKDGTERPIDDSAAPIRDASGAVIGVVLIFRDVTEQRHAEQELQTSDARKSAILETALDCIITMDHQGKVVEFNPAAERTFGYPRAEILGQELANFIIPPSFRDQHRRGMAHYLATGDGPVLGKRLELTALRADGSEFPVELAITRIPTDGSPLFTAYVRDITEQRRVEQHRNARLAVTQVLAEAKTVRDAAPALLRAIGEGLGWEVGLLWTLHAGSDQLHCFDSWHQPAVKITAFERASRQRTFARGEGLPGRAWALGKPTWLLDVSKAANFPRAMSAAEEGLHGAFACPLVVSGKTVGVIEFFTQSIREPDSDTLETMGTIADLVGQFIDRKRSEEALQQSEKRFRNLMEQAPFSIQIFSTDGRTLRVNPAWEELWGVPFEHVANYNVLEDPQLEAKGVLPSLRLAFAGEWVVLPAIEYDPKETLPGLEWPRNSLRYVSGVAYPLKDEAGNVQQVVIVHEDITARQYAEMALRDSEERLRLALEAGRMGVWDWNIRTGDLSWSDSLEPLHGIPPGTFGGTFQDFQQLIYPDDRQMAGDAIWQAVQNKSTFYTEFRNVLPSGGIHWIAGSGKVFLGADGEPARMIGVGMDVTQRKRSEQTARFLADASAALAVLVDFDSTLQKVASLAVPHFADWATVDLVENDGASLRRVAVAHVDPAKVELAHELQRRLPPNPEAPRGAWHILRTGQSEIVSEITDEMLRQAVHDPEILAIMRQLGLKSYIGVPLKVRGKPLGVLTFIAAESGHQYDDADLAVAQDLADRAAIAIENAQLYRELRVADRRKDEFLATLAHELRNPLAPIRNGLQVLKLSGEEDGDTSEVRSIMERQLDQMVRLVDDLLDVSRITRNSLELRKQPTDLANVVHSAIETSRPLIEQAGHHISVVLPSEPVLLEADAVRLAQVFSNLLNNSAKYTEPGGRISLEVERVGSEALVRVRDNGLGIPADALPHIFEMFSQVDSNLDRAQGGLGIGLTLVRRLVEMHGGAIEAHSDGPGLGSEFIVRLPVLTEGARPKIDSRDKTASGESPKRRILVVDDNQDAAMSLGMMLRIMGNEVRTAHDGLAAIDAAAEFLPEMILLDIGLPKLNGYDVCRRIRDQSWSNGIVIIALTGWGQEDDRRRSADAGFNHHLVKPVDLAALESLLAAPRG